MGEEQRRGHVDWPHGDVADRDRVGAQEPALAQRADVVDMPRVAQRLLHHVRHLPHRHDERAQAVRVEGFEGADRVEVDELRLG